MHKYQNRYDPNSRPKTSIFSDIMLCITIAENLVFCEN
jgi:hypothetical protein